MRADTCIVQKIVNGKRYLAEVCDGRVVSMTIIEPSVCVPSLASPAPAILPAPAPKPLTFFERWRALLG